MGNCFQNCDKNISIKIDIYIYILFIQENKIDLQILLTPCIYL